MTKLYSKFVDTFQFTQVLKFYSQKWLKTEKLTDSYWVVLVINDKIVEYYCLPMKHFEIKKN